MAVQNPQMTQDPYYGATGATGQPPYYSNSPFSPSDTGVQPGGQGQNGPPGQLYQYGFLENSPSDVVFRALMDMGIDPTSSGPGMRQLLQRANDIYATALGRGYGSGALQQSIETNNPQMMMDLVKNIIQQGVQGGRVLGGFSGNFINQLAQTAQNAYANPGSGSMADQVIAKYLSDNNQATSLISSLLFGGQSRGIASALSAPLAKLPTMYQEGLESGQWGPGTPAGDMSALSLLNRLSGGLYGQFR